MSRLSITVTGQPRPQGSKDQFGREASKGLPAWRSDVRDAAYKVMSNLPNVEAEAGGPILRAFWEAPLAVHVTFQLPRPKNHYLPANSRREHPELRADAPRHPAGKPDLDKLQRAVLDALTGVVWRDDSQVIRIDAYKTYGRPGANIIVSEAP